MTTREPRTSRREFLKLTATASAAALAGRADRLCAEPEPVPARAVPAIDYAAAQRALGDHKIARFAFRNIGDSFGRAIGPNAKGGRGGQTGGSSKAAIITTDQGVTGWAMAGGAKEDGSKYVGTRVGDLFSAQRGLADDAPWWLDKVMHDLSARILDVPVYQLLGAKGHRKVWMYSGAIYFDDLMPRDAPKGIDNLLANCRLDYRAGYRAFKLKMGRGFKAMNHAEGLRRDIEVVHAVRKAFADCRILVDANDGWTVDDACQFVAATADCNLFFIEEPFEEHRDGLKRLREALAKAGSKALIADGEARKEAAKTPTEYGGYTQAFIDNLYALAAAKLLDVVVLDLDIVGMSRWRRVMPKLTAAGRPGECLPGRIRATHRARRPSRRRKGWAASDRDRVPASSPP
jgi:hypothetical protein